MAMNHALSKTNGILNITMKDTDDIDQVLVKDMRTGKTKLFCLISEQDERKELTGRMSEGRRSYGQ